MEIAPYYERLLQFSSEQFGTEIIEARIRYFATIGRVSESETGFEQHLTNFLDWYVFERKLNDSGRTPAELFFEQYGSGEDEEQRLVLEGFTKTRRSLFQVLKSGAEGVALCDLLERIKLCVIDPKPRGFARKEIFQGRVIPVGECYYLSEALIFHPMRANRYIRNRARAHRKLERQAKENLLSELAQKRLQSDRYKHVDVLYFYK
ncbi:MAG: hypothetical protein P9M14_06795 [Candidatus Alcyoniella australis]|nr:hypothetical protein [Candidatus Alcyoniella australis]